MMPIDFTILPYLSWSRRMRAANSSGVVTKGSTPPAALSFCLTLGRRERLVHRGAQADQHRFWRAGGGEQREPDRDLVARIKFADRRQLGELGRALLARGRERAQLAGLDLGFRRRAGEHRRGVAGDGRHRRRRPALERHVQEIDAGALLQYFHRQMVLAPVAARRVGQRRRGASRIFDELLEVAHGQRRIDRKHELIRRDGRDRGEILQRVERHLGVEVRIDRDQAVLAEEQRVAVGRRLRDHVAGDVAVGAGMVLDHDRLVEKLGEFLSDHARDDVGGAAGRDRHDELDRARGILRERRSGRQRKEARRKEARQFRRHGASFRISWGIATIRFVPHADRCRSCARREGRPCQPDPLPAGCGRRLRPCERAARPVARPFPARAQHGARARPARRHPHVRPRRRGAGREWAARVSGALHPRGNLPRPSRRAGGRAQPFAQRDSLRRDAAAAAPDLSHERVPGRGCGVVRNTRHGGRYGHARQQRARSAPRWPRCWASGRRC